MKLRWLLFAPRHRSKTSLIDDGFCVGIGLISLSPCWSVCRGTRPSLFWREGRLDEPFLDAVTKWPLPPARGQHCHNALTAMNVRTCRGLLPHASPPFIVNERERKSKVIPIASRVSETCVASLGRKQNQSVKADYRVGTREMFYEEEESEVILMSC